MAEMKEPKLDNRMEPLMDLKMVQLKDHQTDEMMGLKMVEKTES